jgi:hypothetical protein
MKRFRKVALTTGILFGLGYGLLSAFYYGDSLLAIIIGTLLVCLIAGSIMGGIACLMTIHLKTQWFFHLIIAVTMAIVGLLLGGGFLFAFERLPHGFWIPLKPPPEKPIKFIGNSSFNIWGGSIYVEIDSGNIYSYTCDSENPCDWKLETKPLNISTGDEQLCSSGKIDKYTVLPILGAKVMDSCHIIVPGPDYSSELSFVILDDGSVLSLSRFTTATGLLFVIIIWLIFGLIVGITGYLSLAIRKDKTTW